MGDNGGLCVGSFPDPSPAEGRGRRAPFTGGAGGHGTLLPVPGALLEEGPGEQGEFDPQGLGSNREGCTQTLPRACLPVPAPALGLKELPGVGLCHLTLHIAVGGCGFLMEKPVCSFHTSFSGKRNPLRYLIYR